MLVLLTSNWFQIARWTLLYKLGSQLPRNKRFPASGGATCSVWWPSSNRLPEEPSLSDSPQHWAPDLLFHCHVPSLYLSLKSFSLGEIDTLFWQPCYPLQSAVLSGFELWAGLRLSLSLGNMQANPKPSFKIRRSMETDHLWVPSPLRWALSRVRTSQPVAVCSENHNEIVINWGQGENGLGVWALFQRNAVWFALVLELDNKYVREIQLGICMCFKNWEQNLLKGDIFSNWILC